MNAKMCKKIRRLLLPSRVINGERISSGKLFRGTTELVQKLVLKSTTNPKRIRFGRTPVGELVQSTHSYQARLANDCPRATYQRIKG